MGRHYANFRAITDDLLAHDAIRIVEKEGLAETLIELLQDRAGAEKMGERARQVFDQKAGATGRCIEALRELLSSRSDGERRQ
jgi:3-deoxy-D-manno-octulosonic-acid transferase